MLATGAKSRMKLKLRFAYSVALIAAIKPHTRSVRLARLADEVIE
jgi:hypothetical protein